MAVVSTASTDFTVPEFLSSLTSVSDWLIILVILNHTCHNRLSVTPQILNFKHIMLTSTSYISRLFFLNRLIVHWWCHIFTFFLLLSHLYFPVYLAEVPRLSLQHWPLHQVSKTPVATSVKSNSPTLGLHACGFTRLKIKHCLNCSLLINSLSLTLSSLPFCLAIYQLCCTGLSALLFFWSRAFVHLLSPVSNCYKVLPPWKPSSQPSLALNLL